jgi:hypothetical protein
MVLKLLAGPNAHKVQLLGMVSHLLCWQYIADSRSIWRHRVVTKQSGERSPTNPKTQADKVTAIEARKEMAGKE